MAEADELERSLAIARAALRPPAGARDRVRHHLASHSTDVGASRVPSERGVTKLTTTVLVGAGVLSGYLLGLYQSGSFADGEAASPPVAVAPSSKPNPPPSVLPSAPAPTSAAAARPTAAVARAEAPSPAPSGSAERVRRARSVTDPGLDELTLLSRAERTLRAGEPMLALTFLDELDRRYQNSRLREERSAARLLADCMLEAPGARTRAELFLRDRQVSVYSDRLRRTCALQVTHSSAGSANKAGSSER